MMRLLSSPPSPFGRKVKITAKVKGVWDQIAVEAVNPNSGADPVLASSNPLGKIPALVLPDGRALYDSRVICEYLDTMSPSPVLFPPAGAERFAVLTRAARADGLMEAALLTIYEERFRPEDKRSADWVARQHGKIDQALSAFEADLPHMSGAIDISHIGLASALGYLDFRLGGRWRAGHTALVSWLDRFAASVPGFAATAPPG